MLPLLRLIRTPGDIFSGAALYLRIYPLGYPFLLLYDFGAAALRARGDSRSPFFALMLSGIANVVLNVLFVTALRLDVAGVAIATGVSNALSAALVLRRLHCIGMLKRAGRGAEHTSRRRSKQAFRPPFRARCSALQIFLCRRR